MFFISFLIVLLLFSFGEVLFKKTSWKVFNIVYVILVVITAVRYGVGTDFFNYEFIYKETPVSFGSELLDVYHGEPGFLFLISLFKLLGADFYVFNAFWGIMSMLAYYIGIKRYCVYPFLSLLVFYCIFYFTYPFNAIRQGLTIALFFAVSLKYLYQKETLKYVMCTILFSLFHASILFTLVFPILLKFKLDLRSFTIMFLIAALFPIQKLLILCTPPVFHTAISFYSDSEVSLLGVLARMIFFFPILYYISKNENKNVCFLTIRNLYLWGMIIYVLFISYSFIASRLNVYTRLIELILLPGFCMCYYRKTTRLVSFIIISVLLSYLYVKNVEMLIDNSLLDNSVFDYPLFYNK